MIYDLSWPTWAHVKIQIRNCWRISSCWSPLILHLQLIGVPKAFLKITECFWASNGCYSLQYASKQASKKVALSRILIYWAWQEVRRCRFTESSSGLTSGDFLVDFDKYIAIRSGSSTVVVAAAIFLPWVVMNAAPYNSLRLMNLLCFSSPIK